MARLDQGMAPTTRERSGVGRDADETTFLPAREQDQDCAVQNILARAASSSDRGQQRATANAVAADPESQPRPQLHLPLGPLLRLHLHLPRRQVYAHKRLNDGRNRRSDSPWHMLNGMMFAITADDLHLHMLR